MKTIWKFKLDITDKQIIKVPKGALLLATAQIQDGIPVIWGMCDSSIKEMDNFTIITIGTGNPIFFDTKNLQYIGTYQLLTFVGHVFIEKIK